MLAKDFEPHIDAPFLLNRDRDAKQKSVCANSVLVPGAVERDAVDRHLCGHLPNALVERRNANLRVWERRLECKSKDRASWRLCAALRECNIDHTATTLDHRRNVAVALRRARAEIEAKDRVAKARLTGIVGIVRAHWIAVVNAAIAAIRDTVVILIVQSETARCRALVGIGLADWQCRVDDLAPVWRAREWTGPLATVTSAETVEKRIAEALTHSSLVAVSETDGRLRRAAALVFISATDSDEKYKEQCKREKHGVFVLDVIIQIDI